MPALVNQFYPCDCWAYFRSTNRFRASLEIKSPSQVTLVSCFSCSISAVIFCLLHVVCA